MGSARTAVMWRRHHNGGGGSDANGDADGELRPLELMRAPALHTDKSREERRSDAHGQEPRGASAKLF
jgi:hypothetical protein